MHIKKHRHVQRTSNKQRETSSSHRVSGPTEEEPRFTADLPPPILPVDAPHHWCLIAAFRQRKASWRSFVVILDSSPMTTDHDRIPLQDGLWRVTFTCFSTTLYVGCVRYKARKSHWNGRMRLGLSYWILEHSKVENNTIYI